MAKGQKKTNREVRKPKAKKLPVAPANASLLVRGGLEPVMLPKQKR